jgi:hypothetical protein
MSKQLLQFYHDSVSDIDALRARIRYLTACMEIIEPYVPLEVLERLEAEFNKGDKNE